MLKECVTQLSLLQRNTLQCKLLTDAPTSVTGSCNICEGHQVTAHAQRVFVAVEGLTQLSLLQRNTLQCKLLTDAHTSVTGS